MRLTVFKNSNLWNNIGELTFKGDILALSVYKSALFYGHRTRNPRP
jgi:hypothetical protein